MRYEHVLYCLFAGVLLGGCTSTVRVGEQRGRSTTYEDPGTPGTISGVGIESQDIVSMTDAVMRDILASREVMGDGPERPRVVMDAQYLRNESSSILNKNILTERLRAERLRRGLG